MKLKYKVLGYRLLVKVKKFNKETTYEGTRIMMAEQTIDMEAVRQSVGEVVQLGNMAYKDTNDGSTGEPWTKVGDLVHFQKYGAIRLPSGEKDTHEFWVINDKDVLAIEEQVEETINV